MTQLTEAQIADLESRWRRAQERRQVAPCTIPPLPWRTRLRLRCQHAYNVVGIWLAGHDMAWAARKLWRI